MSAAVATSPDLAPLWKIVGQLLSAGRRHDAEVTLRSAAETTGSLAIRVNLGTLLAERGALREAIDEWTRVLVAAIDSAEGELLSLVYHNLAALYREQGDYVLAAAFQQQSLRYLSDGEARDFLHLANDAISQRKYGLAEQLLETASALNQDAEGAQGNEALAFEIVATQGLLAGFQGEPRRGWRALVATCRWHEQQGEYRLAAKDLVNLGALLAQLGHHRLGLSCLRRARGYAAISADALLQSRIAHLLPQAERDRCRERFQPEWN